jgi:drug/metabolite transporter (DMT)-like permease
MTSSWMIVAGLFFATMAVFVKYGAEHYGAAELAFYRSLATCLVAYAALRMAKGTIRSEHTGTHLIRGTVGALSLVGYFYAITHLPVATAQTLNYTSPLFLAIATTVVMGERFSPWLVAAVLGGFVGVGMLLQPNFASGTETAALVGLLSGILASWAYLAVRTLGRLGEPDWRVVFWFGLISTLVCAIWQLASSTFHAITWSTAWILFGLGACGTLGQVCMTRAYRTGNTLVVGAYSYSTIVFGVAFGIVLWNDRLSALEWGGIATIVASGLVAMRQEKKEQIEEAGFEG